MEYDVESLARASALSVDTIRFYQSKGLLPAPERRGRRAVYSALHLERLERIRALADKGFSLKAVGALLDAGDASESDRLLLGAIEDEVSAKGLSSAELAARLGVPEGLVSSVENAGLAVAEQDEGGEPRYSGDDVRVATGALRLLKYGFPLTKLLTLAVRHDRAVRKIVDQSIDLFDDQVRKKKDGEEDPEAVAEAFRELLPAVTALVAHHFQRVLVNRAVSRLRKSGEKKALRDALRETKKTRLGNGW
jgi:DNA-binding transcriptional MerR regulator